MEQPRSFGGSILTLKRCCRRAAKLLRRRTVHQWSCVALLQNVPTLRAQGTQRKRCGAEAPYSSSHNHSLLERGRFRPVPLALLEAAQAAGSESLERQVRPVEHLDWARTRSRVPDALGSAYRVAICEVLDAGTIGEACAAHGRIWFCSEAPKHWCQRPGRKAGSGGCI